MKSNLELAMGTRKPNTASVSQYSCKACGWPVIDACCNDEFHNFQDASDWDRWLYCSNKGCKNHDGEGVFQNNPGWVGESRDGPEPSEVRQAKYWSTREDDESLSDESIDDAVDYYVNQFAPEEKLPAEVVVYGFAQTKPKLSGVLEQALEWLDEEYANPEGESTQPTDAMREAERVFIAAVLKDYDCWACEVVDKVTVDLKKWCADNDREWP